MLSFVENSGDIIVLLLFFGVSIFIHELGHFLVAIKLGLVVDTFSIGFGPAIWKKEVNGIVFKICWIPLGGYVALPQLDPTGMSTVQGVSEDCKEVEHRVLPEISPARRIAVSVAGAAGNVVLAVVFAMIIWLSPGAITYKGAPVIESVEESSAVYASGLRGGDEIIAINEKQVSTWYDVSMEMLLIGSSTNVDLVVQSGQDQRSISVPMVMHEGAEIPVFEGIARQTTPCILKAIIPDSRAEEAGLMENDIIKTFDGIKVTGTREFISLVGTRAEKKVPIVIEREGEELTLEVIPKYSDQYERALIGVQPMDFILPWMQEKRPIAQLKSDAMRIVRLLKALVTPKEAKNAASGMGGPVMIFAALWMAIKISMFNAIGFLRFLNINLAILNLLPLPILDGGHVMFALWEGVTKRKVNAKVVNVLVNACGVILIGIFLIITFRDVDRIFPKIRSMFSRGDKTECVTNAVQTNAVEDINGE